MRRNVVRANLTFGLPDHGGIQIDFACSKGYVVIIYSTSAFSHHPLMTSLKRVPDPVLEKGLHFSFLQKMNICS